MRFLPVLLLLLHVLVVRVLMLLMSCCHVVIQQKAWLILPIVICLSHWLSCSKKEFEVRFLPGPPNSPEPRRVQLTKKWPRKKKKRMASWARQRQQITEAADGGARARTGADGRTSTTSLQGGEHRLTKLGKGFFRDKYYEYLVHVPVIIRDRRRSGRNAGAGCERRDWLPVNKLGGAMTRHPAHLTEEQVAQRVRQQVEASLGDPAAPLLQRPTSLGGQHPEHAVQELQDRGGDAPAPAHEGGPEERELPAAL